MIYPTNNKIIVSVNAAQKSEMVIAGVVFKLAPLFERNYRERSPTIATVIDGNEMVKKGDVLLCHHNLFFLPSPYHLYDDIFSIPFSKVLFAKINNEGEISPICGNLICDRIPIQTPFPVPSEEVKTYDKIYKVVIGGDTKYKKGDTVFTRPSAGYDIVYNLSGIEKRITKVDSEQICGVLV